MEKQGVPMNQYPQSADINQQLPPVYVQDPNQQQYQQGQPMSAQPQQPQYTGPESPAYVAPQQTGFDQTKDQGHPGMPPQAHSGIAYQTATPIASLNRGPAPADCPACRQRAMTNVSYEVGNSTHAWALGICFFTICLGFIPYVVNSVKDVQHKCGSCGVLLATWHRSGSTEVHIHS